MDLTNLSNTEEYTERCQEDGIKKYKSQNKKN